MIFAVVVRTQCRKGRKKKAFLLSISTMTTRKKDGGTDHLQRSAGLGLLAYSYGR